MNDDGRPAVARRCVPARSSVLAPAMSLTIHRVLLTIAIGTAIIVWSSFSGLLLLGDYEWQSVAAVTHLVAGDVAGFARGLPTHAGAMVLEVPAIALGATLGSDAVYAPFRAQVLLGLLALALVSTWIVLQTSGEGPSGARQRWTAVTLAALLTGSPLIAVGIELGHPEEPLVLALVLAGAWATYRGHALRGAALLGVASAAKPWAVLALFAALALSYDRRDLGRRVATAATAGACLLAPLMIVAGPSTAASLGASTTTGIFKPATVFWFAGKANPSFDPAAPAPVPGSVAASAPSKPWAARLEPAAIAHLSHPLVILVGLFLAWSVGLKRELSRSSDARRDLWLLIAAVLWWRCLLDTWNAVYYAAPPIAALAIWEACGRRPPLGAVAAAVLTWVSFQRLPGIQMSPDAGTLLYLSWALPLGVGMVVRLLAPTAASRVTQTVLRPVAARLPTLAALVTSGRAA